MAQAHSNGGTVRNGGSFEERFSALDERVTNLRTSFQHLEQSTASGFGRLDAKLGEMAAAFQAGQQTPWSTIWTAVGVAFSILLGVGYLVYTPVQANQTRIEDSLIKLSDMFAEAVKSGPDLYVPRREIETGRARATEDRANIEKDIDALRQEKLPRNEWTLRNAAVDAEFVDLRRAVDQMRQDFGSTYSLRDALADFKQRLERIEMQEKRP